MTTVVTPTDPVSPYGGHCVHKTETPAIDRAVRARNGLTGSGAHA